MDKKKSILKSKIAGMVTGIKSAAGAMSEPYKNVAATVMSAPSVISSKIKGYKADRDANIIKTSRAYDNAPNIDRGGPTDAMKSRTAADRIINPMGKPRKASGVNSRALGRRD